MNKIRIACVLGALVASVLDAGVCHAQAPVGGRAAGMAGAFVGVSDDSSAVYWNPAGLATASFVSFEIDVAGDELTPGAGPSSGLSGGRRQVRFIAAGTPPLGISFYQLNNINVTPISGGSAVEGTPNRQEGRRGVSSLRTSHFGVTLLQSIVDGLVVGATVKLVRGSAAFAALQADGSWGDLLDRAGDLDSGGNTTGDVDLGVMWKVRQFQVGVTGRNLTEPDFGEEGSPWRMELKRHARAGVAWGRGWPGTSPLIVAVDTDLTRVPDPGGERRDVAAGVETWWLGQRLGLRGGARASTVGDARPVGSGGVSYAVRPGVYVDAHLSGGPDGAKGWGMAARLVY